MTIDTHELHRSMTSPACGRTPGGDDGELALACADAQITGFIDAARRRAPDAVVVLMSDHVAFPNRITRRTADQGARRLRLAAWGAGIEPETLERPGTHFDIAPTVLDLLGLDSWDAFGLGASLLEHASPWLSQGAAYGLRAAPAWLPLTLGTGERIIFESAGPTIVMDGHRLRANMQGFPLDDGVFTLRFDDDGRFDTVLPWQDIGDFERHETGSLVVGVSANAEFNKALGAGEGTVYFAGRMGSQRTLAVGTVDERTELIWRDTRG